MKRFVIDASKCIRCCNCQIACKDEYCDNDWSPIAALQGEGQFWVKVTEKEISAGEKVCVSRMPLVCQHCENPACAKVVPDAVVQREDGLVILDPAKAQGHPELVDACPYGAIYWNETLNVAQKCTGCAHLMDNGWEEPRCVQACPTDALRFVGDEELTDDKVAAPLEVLNPEYGTKPRVRYQRLPKPFMDGVVVDTQGNSVVGAKIVATHQVTGLKRCAYTNCFGDFSIEGLTGGYYTVQIMAQGYCPRKLHDVAVDEFVDLEEIRVTKLG